MPRYVFIETWGCQMNSYDSKRLLDLLAFTRGFQVTDKPELADLLLMNTCSIREKAQEKVFSRLGQWYDNIKRMRPDIIIGVGGCVASQEGALIRKRAPYVDFVFGPQTLHRVPALLKSVEEGRGWVVDISFPQIEKFDALPAPTAEGPTGLVSIQEGCSKYCHYCIVPYTRGEEVNRPFDDVLVEVAQLAAQGVREVTLLGQNVNAYRGRMHDGSTADLALLLHYLAEIDGIARLRFMTSHPMEFSDSLIQAYATVPQLTNYLHLPVQSGSDTVLARMGRHHTVDAYRYKIARLRAIRPDLSVSSDFIVGYPDESDAEFEATLSLVREIGFDQSYSFIFSPRPGTPAATLPDAIPMSVKKERLEILQTLLTQQGQALAQRMRGTTQSILVTGPSKKDPTMWSGRTENNRVVHFKPTAAHIIGEFLSVRITEVMPSSLRGVPLEACERMEFI